MSDADITLNQIMTQQLLAAPDTQISPAMKEWISAWSDPPKLEEITETRNMSAFTSQCSDLVIRLLTIMMEEASKEAEGWDPTTLKFSIQRRAGYEER
jgi:hypothetical protein